MNTTQDQTIGRIICVSGSQIVTLLDDGLRVDGESVPDALQKGRLVKMRTPDSTSGRKGKCPNCGIKIQIPTSSVASQSSSTSAPP